MNKPPLITPPPANRIVRYNASERVNHWIVALLFIMLALSGLALFHPYFFPLTQLFGGGPWTRILHPYAGVVLFVAFLILAARFWRANLIKSYDIEWLKNVQHIAAGREEMMPLQGKYNGGQKVLYWGLLFGILTLLITGVLMWRAWWNLPIELVRWAALLHAVAAVWCIGLIIVHIYAAIWVKGTLHAMTQGTVSRAWAWHHHRLWYKKIMGQDRH